MKVFNGVVALTIGGLEDEEIEAVKRAAQILHYTLTAFVGPTEHEVIVLVKIEKTPSIILPEYSEIRQGYPSISDAYSKISAPYLTEEEADMLCQEVIQKISVNPD